MKVGCGRVWTNFSLPVIIPGRFPHPSSRTGHTAFTVPRLSTAHSIGVFSVPFYLLVTGPTKTYKVICLVCLLVVVMSSVRRYVMDMDSHLFEVPATAPACEVISLYGFPSRITPSRSPFLIGKGRILQGKILPVFHLAFQVGMSESIG